MRANDCALRAGATGTGASLGLTMTRLYLIRHGTVDGMNERIYGRTPGIHLSKKGHADAEKIAQELASADLEAVYSSPLERAQETAETIARYAKLPVQIEPGLNEIDFGRWTNCRFKELREDPEWERFNSRRSCAGAPGGELMLAAQARAVAVIEKLQQQHGVVAIVSHGDVIRALVAHYVGFNLDFIHRLRIDAGSVTILELGWQGCHFTLINGKPGRLA